MRPDQEALGLTEEEMALTDTIGQAEEEEDAVIGAESPVGQFTAAGFKPLIRNLNELLPLFDAEPYPEITEDLEVWPEDLTRVVMMVETAVSDAIGAQEVDADKAIQMEGVASDRDLKVLASKIRTLARDKNFKRFLTQTSDGEVVVVEEAPTKDASGPTDADMESMFSQRI